MKNIYNIKVLAIFVALIAINITFLKEGFAQSSSSPIAKVDGEVITLGELERVEAALIRQGNDPVLVKKEYERLLSGMIEKRLIRKEALRTNLTNTPEYKEQLEELKGGLLEQTLLNKLSSDVITKAAVEAEYARLKNDGSARSEVKVSHILVDTSQEAQSIISALNRGEVFADIAREKSIDPGSARRGGDLGFIRKGEMIKEFEEASFALKDGEISKAPVKSDQGFHIISRQESRVQELPPFAEIEQQIAQGIFQKALYDYLQNLKAKSKIEIFPRPAR